MECMKLERGPVLSGTLGNNARFEGLWGMVMPQGRRLLANHGQPLCIMMYRARTHARTHHREGRDFRGPGGYVVCRNSGEGSVH